MPDTGRGVPPGRMLWSVGEAHGPPAGVCGGVGVPGPMRASAPTRFAAWRGNVVSRLPTGPALGRRGGFHIRPRDPAPPRGCPGRCKHRPLQRLQQCGVRDFTGGCKPAVGRRGGIYPSRGRSNRRGARRDEGIPPYGRPGGDGNPFGRNVYHGSQGRATALPQNFSNILSRPQGGDPPYLNSELFTLNSELPTLNFRPATA